MQYVEFICICSLAKHRQNFLRGKSLSLDESVGVKKETLSAIARFMGANLTSLQINNVSDPSDKEFAGMAKKLPNLEVLNLRSVTSVPPSALYYTEYLT